MQNGIIPRKSSAKHIKIADDKFQTKFTDDISYDVGNKEFAMGERHLKKSKSHIRVPNQLTAQYYDPRAREPKHS